MIHKSRPDSNALAVISQALHQIRVSIASVVDLSANGVTDKILPSVCNGVANLC